METKKSGLMTGLEGMAIGAGQAVVGQGLGMLFGKSQDKRQIKQQKKLNDLAIESNKEMLNYSQEKQLEMWKATNYKPTVEEMKAAGINPGLLYGMSGGGGATTGAGGMSVGAAGAADASSTQQANTASAGMGMQMAAQTQLLQAQKENIEADTANKKADTGSKQQDIIGKELANYVAGETQQEAVEKIIAEASKATDEAGQAGLKTDHDMQTFEAKVKATQEEALRKILENEGIKTENRQKVAELAVKQFEAEMAKNGIANNTPWYVKFLTELANKFNLNPLK